MPHRCCFFLTLTLSLNYNFAAQTEPQSATSNIKAETTFQRIMNSYPKEQVFTVVPDTSLFIKLSNQHNVSYGRVILLTPYNREPEQLDVGHSIQSKLPKFGWDIYVYYHSSKDSLPSPDQYQNSIQQAITLVRQQSELPLFIVAFDQAAKAIINLAAKEAPNVNAIALILTSSVTTQLEYPSTWSTPIMIFNSSKESGIPIELRKVAPQVIHKPIAHESLINSSGSFISHQLHGWFKKVVQSN